jgi:hypothetical protein
MIFNQEKNGSGNIVFSEEEIKIIEKHKKIHLSAEGLKKFGDNLIEIVLKFQNNFDDKLSQKMTYGNSVDIEKPKDNT